VLGGRPNYPAGRGPANNGGSDGAFAAVAAVVVVSMLVVGVVSAEAVVICQRKKRITLRSTCKKKETQVTLGADSVPNAMSCDNATSCQNATSAQNADTVGGQPASAFEPMATRIPLTTVAKGGELQVATVGPFAVLFNCNDGSGNTPGDAAVGIKNIGEDHSLARTSDDDDDDFNIGESVYFDFDDAGDAGIAVSPSGWIVQVNAVGELAADAVTPRTIGNNECVFTTTYTVLAHP
jgi:hypothetical protein